MGVEVEVDLLRLWIAGLQYEREAREMGSKRTRVGVRVTGQKAQHMHQDQVAAAPAGGDAGVGSAVPPHRLERSRLERRFAGRSVGSIRTHSSSQLSGEHTEGRAHVSRDRKLITGLAVFGTSIAETCNDC